MNRTSTTNMVSEYLNKMVSYGGIRMPRYRMIAQLTEAAKATGRADWRILVDRYLQGHELVQQSIEKEKGMHQSNVNKTPA